MTEEFKPIVWTEEELQAMRDVRAQLKEEHGIEESRVGDCFLGVVTVNCKCRVEETVPKLLKFLKVCEALDCPEGFGNELWKPDAVHELGRYVNCGLNNTGARTVWVKSGKKVQQTDEKAHVQACVMHYLADHADDVTLRNGLTIVLDIGSKEQGKKIGNEKMIQNFYQALPQRPQEIFIVGTNTFTRALVNATIKLASVFVKQKILSRIRFATQEEARDAIPLESAPVYVGGKGGNIESKEEWVKMRLSKLTRPAL